jgi:hypothetical protein
MFRVAMPIFKADSSLPLSLPMMHLALALKVSAKNKKVYVQNQKVQTQSANKFV